jgi:CRP-like cAMP-binding protein
MSRSANVVAASDTSVLAMNRREFATVLDSCPGIARHVLETAIGRMAAAV